MEAAHFILKVAEQDASTRFYAQVLAREPDLRFPGMTEFRLPGGAVLGLMSEAGIKRLLGEHLPDPATANGTLHAELYLVVQDAHTFHESALAVGGDGAERARAPRLGPRSG